MMTLRQLSQRIDLDSLSKAVHTSVTLSVSRQRKENDGISQKDENLQR